MDPSERARRRRRDKGKFDFEIPIGSKGVPDRSADHAHFATVPAADEFRLEDSIDQYQAAFHSRVIADLCTEPGPAELTASPETTRGLVAQWAAHPEQYEDYADYDARFRYDTRPGVPTDPDTQKALRKLGYETYLNQKFPLFVYGTLASGQANAHLLAEARAQSADATLPDTALYASPNGYPYAVPDASAEAGTVGELVWLHDDDAGFQARIDADLLEGFDSDHPSWSHYRRVDKQLTYLDPDGQPRTTTAWVYMTDRDLIDLPDTSRVPNGNWIARQDLSARGERGYSRF